MVTSLGWRLLYKHAARQSFAAHQLSLNRVSSSGSALQPGASNLPPARPRSGDVLAILGHVRPEGIGRSKTSRRPRRFPDVCDAAPRLGHLHGDCTQKVAFADVHAAMAQDCVGGCEMEIEVRQHEMF